MNKVCWSIGVLRNEIKLRVMEAIELDFKELFNILRCNLCFLHLVTVISVEEPSIQALFSVLY